MKRDLTGLGRHLHGACCGEPGPGWRAGGAAAVATARRADRSDRGRRRHADGRPACRTSTSPNVAVGYLVPDYEVWNLQYATLTDKAADDFAHDPRPGRVVGGLRGRADVHVHAARGPEVVRRRAAHRRGRRLHDQPVARRGVAQPLLDDRRTSTATALDERTVEITSSVPDPKLPTMDVYIVPKHIYEKYDTPKRSRTTTALDGVGSGPFTLDEWQARARSGRGQGQPELLGAASRRSTRSSSGSSPTPTRWSPRSQRARSTPPTTSRTNVVRAARGRRGHRGRRRASRAASTSSR